MNGLALSSGKRDLIIDPPIMNSAGILGFVPEATSLFDPGLLGAFVTNPISRRRISPAKPSRLECYPGGMLLHTGLPNPGLQSALKAFSRSWEMFDRPMILHVLADQPQDMKAVVELLDSSHHSIQALEIGISSNITAHQAEVLLATAALSQLPILARVSPDTGAERLQAAISAGVNAIVMGPPRGRLPTDDGEVSGRLYGPAIHPMARYHLDRILDWVDVPVILGCGLYSADEIRGAFSGGASGVQLDTMLWLDPGPVIDSLLQPLEQV